jgi:hypothetical protein
MNRNAKAFAVCLIATGAPNLAFADINSCTLEQDNLASKRLIRASNLREVYEISKTIPGCMRGGGISEEVSDDVVSRLSHQWQVSLRELNTNWNDHHFISFVMNHIDSTTDADDLRTILRNAKHSCSPKSALQCRRIEAAAHYALNHQ